MPIMCEKLQCGIFLQHSYRSDWVGLELNHLNDRDGEVA
jgi:hypothetical protein